MNAPAAVKSGPLAARWLLLATFCACLWLYSERNDFPFFYHSDEESKTLQVLQHYRNMWHPLLLVNVTQWTAQILAVAQNEQALTRCGRFVSAVFGAAGVSALTMLAWRRQGFAVAATLALFLGTLPMLFEVSHYFKEDAALLLGASLVLLAADVFQRRRNLTNLLLLAMACAIAAAAKYIGLLLLPAGLLLAASQRERWKNLGVFLGAFLFTLLAIDWQWLLSPAQLWRGVTRETVLLGTGHYGMVGAAPQWKYSQILLSNVPPWMVLIGLLGMVLTCRPRGGRNFERIAVGGASFFMLGLCLLTKTSDRYLLPVLALFFYFFAIGLVQLAALAGRLLPRPILPLCIAAAWWPQFTMLNHYRREFRADSRAELAAWVAGNLPPQTRVATSLWTRLPGFYAGQAHGEAPPADFAADLGTLADLRNQGIGYVAVAEAECSRFFANGRYSENGATADFFRRRAFYQALMEGRAPLWQKPLGRVYILHPGLRLYAVPAS